ncbi:MAG: hypothetical protein QG656_2395, partial [Candidatus Hydrogenedentes bacterium]|nr:hypothetical protein [Candidatus Hydrogenedentota bacterium]
PNRYAFVACCYYTMLIMPCLYGFMPYFMMNRERRNQFLRRVQHGRTLWTRLPLLFIKMVCAMYLFGQTSYLRSVGAR